MILENLRMAFSSLRTAKLRSFLTMLGIIIGVSAVVSILAIGAGVKQAVQNEITGVVNANAIAVASGKINLGKGGGGGAASSVGASTLTTKDVTAVQGLDHVTAVAPISLVSGLVMNGKTQAEGALILATTPAFSATQTMHFTAGSFFTAAQADQNVVVLGGQAKTELFGDGPALGKTILIRGTPFIVVGAVKTSDSAAASSLTGGSSFDNAVFLPFAAAKNLTGSDPQILRLLTQVDSAANVNAVAADMNRAILKSHGGQDDFTVLTQKDILDTVSTVLNLLTTFIVAIASISLLVGGIGIMNIMLVNVSERTREIGLRKAIGASSLTVLGQFLIEAVVLSVLGGAIGILVAVVQATAAGKLAKITPVFTPGAIALAVGVSAGVGIIFGIAPAIKAARKRPIQALKAE